MTNKNQPKEQEPIKEDWKEAFAEWHLGYKLSTPYPPLAMQIEYWFDKNVVAPLQERLKEAEDEIKALKK